jgi:integrase
MAKHLLTDRGIANLAKRAKEYLTADGGGLFLRTRPSGTKGWMFIYTFAGRRRKLSLGEYGLVSLSAARAEAARLHEALARQIDPGVERAERRAEQEERRRAAERAKARLTVGELFEKWVQTDLSRRKDKGAGVKRSFGKDILPFIGKTAVEDVKRGNLTACLHVVVERGAPIQARCLLGDLTQMFTFAIRRGSIESSPAGGLRRNDFGKKAERDRVLSDDEIRLLAELLPDSGLSEAGQTTVWALLATCARIGEIAQARWEHVDFDAGTWRIPPESAKNGRGHAVFLSGFAQQQFLALRDLAAGSPWVLPATKKDGHICAKTLAKQTADRQRGQGAKLMTHRSGQTGSLVLPGGKWTPHDLRRTAATVMGDLGVRGDTIERCLNHTEPSSVRRVYQRQKLESEQREAWWALGDRLELLTGRHPNVVPMPARMGRK